MIGDKFYVCGICHGTGKIIEEACSEFTSKISCLRCKGTGTRKDNILFPVVILNILLIVTAVLAINLEIWSPIRIGILFTAFLTVIGTVVHFWPRNKTKPEPQRQ